MKQLRTILYDRDEKIKLIKHATNDAINNFWSELNSKQIYTDLGWTYIKVSLLADLITFNLEHIFNNYKYTLSASIKITTVLSNSFNKDNIQFIQSYPQSINTNLINSSNQQFQILDPNIWVNMKNILYQLIDDYIGYTN